MQRPSYVELHLCVPVDSSTTFVRRVLVESICIETIERSVTAASAAGERQKKRRRRRATIPAICCAEGRPVALPPHVACAKPAGT